MRRFLAREIDVAYIGVETSDHRIIDNLYWTGPIPVLHRTERIGEVDLRRYPLPGRPGAIITAEVPFRWRFALALDLVDTEIDSSRFPGGPIHILNGRVAALTRLESPEMWPWHEVELDCPQCHGRGAVTVGSFLQRCPLCGGVQVPGR